MHYCRRTRHVAHRHRRRTRLCRSRPSRPSSPQTLQRRRHAGIEQVIVTARRREESLQDVPVAITALTADQLLEQNVRTLEDMTAYAPNIKVNAGRATSSTINAYIRGVGQNDPLWGFEPGVGIYLDDVYIARPQGALLDVYDVERIEILRGPQGTLYGKNTIAGAIKYVTRDIVVEDPAFNVSATGGSYNQRDLKVSGSMRRRRRPHVCRRGGRLSAARRLSARSSMTARPAFTTTSARTSPTRTCWPRASTPRSCGAKSSKLRVLGDLIQDDSNAVGGKRLNNLVQPALNDRYDQRTDMPVDQDKFETKGVAATFTQSLSDSLDLKIVGAYREGEGNQFIDFEELNANIFQVPAAVRRRSDERRSAAHAIPAIVCKGVAGVYYFTGEAFGAFDASLGTNPRRSGRSPP